MVTIEGYLLAGLEFAELTLSLYEYQIRAVLANFFDQINVYSEYGFADITIQSTSELSNIEFCPVDQTTFTCPTGNTLVTFRIKVDTNADRSEKTIQDPDVLVDGLLDYFRNIGHFDVHNLGRYRNSVVVGDEHCGSLPTQEVCYAKCALDMDADGWVQEHEYNINNELYTAGYFYQGWGKNRECGVWKKLKSRELQVS